MIIIHISVFHNYIKNIAAIIVNILLLRVCVCVCACVYIFKSLKIYKGIIFYILNNLTKMFVRYVFHDVE